MGRNNKGWLDTQLFTYVKAAENDLTLQSIEWRQK